MEQLIETTLVLYGRPTNGQEEFRPYGTAFIVSTLDSADPDYGRRFFLVTAAHVVRGAVETEVRVPSDPKRRLSVSDWSISSTSDAAVLSVPGSFVAYLGRMDYPR